MNLKALAQKLDKDLGVTVTLKPFGRTKELMFEIPSRDFLSVCQWIRSEDSARLDWADNFSAAEIKSNIILTLFLRSQALTHTMILRTEVPFRQQEKVITDSVTKIWPMIKAEEEEISNLFGIEFQGADFNFSPGPYPLRKEFSWEFDR